MFKKKIFPILLALFAVVLLPTAALAQTTEDTVLYEDWDYSEYDWSDYYNDYYDDDSYTYELSDLSDSGAMIAAFSTLFAVWGLIFTPIALGVYIYMSIAYMTIAKKLNTPNSWFAWVPILRSVLAFQIAGMSGWFVLLLLIPVVNVVVSIIALMKTCERRGMDKLLGLLGLIPGANLVLLGILAWKKDTK
ncbi:MAG: DUF5684 domain-containing protein [Candidatus Dojkabacteria bacterium]|nr:DUF5684 domain-containing protein [Candidatus Dojkabacteria bacterium]